MLLKFAAVLMFVFGVVLSQTYDTAYCFDRLCPTGTSACKKIVKSVQDKYTTSITIYCLDGQDLVVEAFFSSGHNPYKSSTSFDSISYASVDNQPRYQNINYLRY